MSKLICCLFTAFFLLSNLSAQSFKHAIEVGSNFSTDFDNYGWYSNSIGLSHIGYMYSFQEKPIQLEFICTALIPNVNKRKLLNGGYGLFEVYKKEVFTLDGLCNYSIREFGMFEVQGGIGVSGRLGKGIFTAKQFAFDSTDDIVSFDGLGLAAQIKLLVDLNSSIQIQVYTCSRGYMGLDRTAEQLYGVKMPNYNLSTGISLIYNFSKH